MKNKILLYIVIVFVVFICGCTSPPDYNLYVVQCVDNHTRVEIDKGHTEYVTYNERRVSGYYSRWKGDINNTAAIEEDYSVYKIWYCDIDTDHPCEKIKKDDIVSVRHSIIYGYEREIVGSIKR